MKFQLVAVGRGMPAAVKTLVAEYQSRLLPFGGCVLSEVAEHRRTGGNGERNLALSREGERIRELLAGAPYVALDGQGKSLSSEGLSQTIHRTLEEGHRQMRFIIGGPDGLHEDLLQQAVWRLSLGAMTFPHMLARVILLEQLYRAMTIIRHIPYHR